MLNYVLLYEVLCIIPKKDGKKKSLPSDRRKNLQQKATLNINLSLGIDRHVNHFHIHHHHKDIEVQYLCMAVDLQVPLFLNMSVEISSCNVSRIRGLGKSLIRRFKKRKKGKRVALHQWPTINNDNSLPEYRQRQRRTDILHTEYIQYIPHNHISKLIMVEDGSLR